MTSKKKLRAIKNQKLSDVRIDVYLKDMRLKDIQRECILRGMDFQEMVESSVLNLSSWLINNYGEKRVRENLDKFDTWMEDQLRTHGKEDLIHPMLNLGFVTETSDSGEVKTKKIKGIRKQIIKKERTLEGVFKGTKKALTFELAKKGLSKAEVIAKVIEHFPEAQEKSIGIWYNRMKKEMK
jgi:hypothetical protein